MSLLSSEFICGQERRTNLYDPMGLTHGLLISALVKSRSNGSVRCGMLVVGEVMTVNNNVDIPFK